MDWIRTGVEQSVVVSEDEGTCGTDSVAEQDGTWFWLSVRREMMWEQKDSEEKGFDEEMEKRDEMWLMRMMWQDMEWIVIPEIEISIVCCCSSLVVAAVRWSNSCVVCANFR